MNLRSNVILSLMICTAAGFCAVGCNTFKGAGKDIQKGGQVVENAADNAADSIREQKKQRHTIVASTQMGGKISPSGSTTLSHGANRTYTIKANKGYHVTDVVVDGNSVGVVDRYTFTGVTSGHTISATFAADSTH